ncbi:hypothetical protein ACTI_35880 [Actinoplanes sp. OR16]|uniref:FAD-dependent monooxygenase n=1 Tax=Actinoplanes sp. OR16 TaxID=946334 RepID=UPI000F6BE525|nr:FAD-dependent monooxygenase [Actinoplanes sp. OR16]BBH66903.1 hypothetical protein ACTI_35880 [Actinoplanes sp. OR16]
MFTESRFTVIAGAGPTGLALARVLQRHGVPFRIVEKSPAPAEGSRGKGLQPRTLEVLDDLGLIADFQAAGGPYPPLLVHLPGGATMTRRMDEEHQPTEAVPYPNMLMVPQWRTTALLADGIPVEYGVSVTDVDQDESGVRVTLQTGETITARYLVGADGGRSVVRKAIGVAFEGSTYEEERMLIADVTLTGLDRDHWHVWPDGGSSFRLSLCPLPGTDQFQLTAPMDSDIPQGLAMGWTSEYRANMRMASRFRVGNVFLAGDAAHVHSPAGGQGLNTGVQDAYNLGWKLATGDPELLDTYEAERLPVAADVLGISTTLHRASTFRRDDPILRQLSLNYRGGPLAAEHRADPGDVQAGDRAPDAPLPAGGRVFDLLRGPHVTVLAFGLATALPDLPGSVRVHHLPLGGPSAAIYDVRGTALFLIRPDNYVGCVSSEPEDVIAYLKRIAH